MCEGLPVLFLLLAVAVVCVALAVLPLVVNRDRGLDEVARFHRARAMTTEWSRAGVTRPVFAEEAAEQSADV
jgi:hypothetical protein